MADHAAEKLQRNFNCVGVRTFIHYGAPFLHRRGERLHSRDAHRERICSKVQSSTPRRLSQYKLPSSFRLQCHQRADAQAKLLHGHPPGVLRRHCPNDKFGRMRTEPDYGTSDLMFFRMVQLEVP
jgi:hypothetical protein